MDYEKKDDVAVFFDFENIVFSLRNNYNMNANFEDLMDKCKEFGRVVVAHSFADWNRHSPAMIPALMSNGFDPVYVPSFTMGSDGQQSVRKNAVDMYMAIDAMDILHNRKSVDTFILLTGDSDFLPLVNAIRREGNRVIAIGVDGSVSSHLAQAVDEFIFYSHFSQIPTSNYKKRPRSVYEGLTEAITELQSRQRSTVLPNVKMMMAELMGGFDEKKHTDSQGRRFQKFKEFVQEGERRGMVKLVTTGTVNEVFLADDKRATSTSTATSTATATAKDKPEEPKTREKEKEKVTGQPALAEAYELLTKAAAKAIKDDKSSRPSSIKGIMTSMYNNFNEKEIEVDGKKPFSRFGEFVKAAEEEGHVKVTGKGHSRRILPPEENGETPAEEQPETKQSEPAPSSTPSKSSRKQKSEKQQKQAVEPVTDKVETIATVAPKEEPEPVADSTPTMIPPKPASANEEEHVGREIIVAGLQSFGSYPAPFLKIEAHCRQVRNERNVYLPSPKVRELLTAATRELGLLQRVSPPGVSPAQYEYKGDARLIAAFMGDDEPTGSTAVVEEPAPTIPDTPEVPQVQAPEVQAPEAPAPSESQAEENPAFALLAQAIQNAEEAGRSTRISAIKGHIRKLEANFDEKQLTDADGNNYKRLSDFVDAAANAGYVKISGKGRNMLVHSLEK